MAQWEQRNTKLIVLIPSLTPESEEAGTGEVEATDDESRSRAGGDRTRRSNTVSRGPQKLLEQLVEWPSFKTSSMTIRMPGNDRPEVAVHNAFVRFESAIMAQHTGRWLGFWGIVRPWNLWAAHDTYYCNFGTIRQSFRIALLRDRTPLSWLAMGYPALMRWLVTMSFFSITPEIQAQGALSLISILLTTSDSCGTIKAAE
ncbi:hypothetical protein [Xanthomonas hortorum]|uniref:hypothetical protein n=1 Tax=Xanthomonas hortorum TaxID=56454 RepID=UPI001F445E33|nr:hypothetical protein [Xanthomonas hortorum]MCE4364851.1 hypothetical protein [Xanthomonas hortorum]